MKGLTVKVTITQKDVDRTNDMKSSNDIVTKSLCGLNLEDSGSTISTTILDDKEEEEEDHPDLVDMYDMKVESGGKFLRNATWSDLSRFTGQEINSNVFRDWVVHYQETCYPEDATKPNHIPKKCYIKDENGGTMYKDFGWKPIKLNLKPGIVDVKERWTKKVCLEAFPLDYSTNIDNILLLDKCDKEVTSILRKSKLAGHPLALEMMKTNSKIVTEFQGINSITFGVLGNNEPSEKDEETGDEVWKDVKTLRALLQNMDLPKRTGNSREACVNVIANETYLKARIYYKAFFSNDVATDHHGKFQDKPFWCWPIKYLFQYNDVPNAAVIYEDIELRFFTDVKLDMNNKEWEWIKDDQGRWKKQYNTSS